MAPSETQFGSLVNRVNGRKRP